MMTRRLFLGALTASAGVGCGTLGGLSKKRLRIAHLADPQFGFGNPGRGTPAAYRRDLMKFESLIERVNEADVDLVLIAGDMTNSAGDLERDWPRLMKLFSAPVVVTPGNHDLGNHVKRENLDRFRRVFGYDRTTFEVKGWQVIAGNSQFWFDTELKEERLAYEKWVEERLEEARRFDGRVILASHIPPFQTFIREPDAYYNFPLAGREARFERYLASGARFYLSGHTHTMLARAHKGLVVLNAETTSHNNDWRPYGGRVFEVSEDFAYTWNFIGIEKERP